MAQKFDDVEWHIQGPAHEADYRMVALPIALFLRFCSTRGMLSSWWIQHPESDARLAASVEDAVALVLAESSGKLSSADLSPEGEAFAEYCYEWFSSEVMLRDEYPLVPAEEFDRSLTVVSTELLDQAYRTFHNRPLVAGGPIEAGGLSELRDRRTRRWWKPWTW